MWVILVLVTLAAAAVNREEIARVRKDCVARCGGSRTAPQRTCVNTCWRQFFAQRKTIVAHPVVRGAPVPGAAAALVAGALCLVAAFA
jgi:hypothetical protein